ncbi:MAG: hypothetical protein WAV18_10820 [Roseiarcus sp.]
MRNLSEGIKNTMTYFCLSEIKIIEFSNCDGIADQRSPRRIRKPYGVANG